MIIMIKIIERKNQGQRWDQTQQQKELYYWENITFWNERASTDIEKKILS